MKELLEYCDTNGLSLTFTYTNGDPYASFVDNDKCTLYTIKIPSCLLKNMSDSDVYDYIIRNLESKKKFHVSHGDFMEKDVKDVVIKEKGTTLREVLPLITMNDVQINDLGSNEDWSIFIRNDYTDCVADKYLNAEVKFIENDEEIPNTIVIGIDLSEQDEEE